MTLHRTYTAAACGTTRQVVTLHRTYTAAACGTTHQVVTLLLGLGHILLLEGLGVDELVIPLPLLPRFGGQVPRPVLELHPRRLVLTGHLLQSQSVTTAKSNANNTTHFLYFLFYFIILLKAYSPVNRTGFVCLFHCLTSS